MMDYMRNGKVTDITEFVRKNREIEEAGMESMQDTDTGLDMPFVVCGLKSTSRNKKTAYSMDDFNPLAAFNDVSDAKGYAKARNLWAADRYPSYVVWDLMTNNLIVLTDLGDNRWALNEVNEA